MKYIITDSIKSVNRIIKRTNDEGIPTYGIESITALGLAWQLIMEKKSGEGLVSIRLINNNTASAIVLELILNNKGLFSFIPEDCISLATAKEVLNNMNLLRLNQHSKIADSRFKELENFIKLYENTLTKRNFYDESMVLQEAIDILKEDSSKIPPEEIEICYYNRPSTIEEEFVSLLNKKAEFNKSETDNHYYTFVKAYGVSNEADYVAKTIVEKNIPLGDTEIICDTALYAPFIKECFTKRGLAYNFTSAESGSGFNLIQIMKNLLDWDLNGCKYEDLFNIMFNPIFGFEFEGKITRAAKAYLKGISYGIGWGKDRYFDVKIPAYDESHAISENDYQKTFREIELTALGELAGKFDEAETPTEILDILVTYCNQHKFKTFKENKYTSGALLNLRKSLSSVKITFSDKKDIFAYLKNELSSISYSQTETYNAANVSRIYTPASIERKHIFVLGLSSKEFKISVAESPILDDKLREKLFGNSPCGNVHLAKNAIDEAGEVVRNLLKSAPKNADITIISSSADNLSDGSDVAASALYEKLLAECGKTEKDILNADTYNDITTYNAEIKHDDAWKEFSVEWPEKEKAYSMIFSKSSIDTLLNCPLQYHYDKDLHINKEEYKDYDPGKWLAANEAGTLVHRILELYANEVLKGNEAVSEIFDENCAGFKNAVKTASEEAESVHAAPSAEIKNDELKNCIDMASKYLTHLHKELHDTGWVVFKCEDDMDMNKNNFKYTYNDVNINLQFNGIIDRIDRKKNGEDTFLYRIQDYKTGKFYDANYMQKNTKQHLIYSHYVEKCYGGKVENFDYLYLKALLEEVQDWQATIDSSKLSVDVLNDEEKEIVYQTLIDHNYMCRDKKKDTCTYCKYKDICLYALKKEGMEEQK